METCSASQPLLRLSCHSLSLDVISQENVPVEGTVSWLRFDAMLPAVNQQFGESAAHQLSTLYCSRRATELNSRTCRRSPIAALLLWKRAWLSRRSRFFKYPVTVARRSSGASVSIGVTCAAAPSRSSFIR